MAHRRGAMHADQAFLLGDVLEQEVLHLLVRAVGVDHGHPLREVADIMVVLLHPLAEQAAVELARGPGLAPRMHRRMALLDGVLESQTERTLGHGDLLRWGTTKLYTKVDGSGQITPTYGAFVYKRSII